MLAIALSLLSAASLGNGAVTGRMGMQGVHPIAVIGVALVVGFVGVALADLALNPLGCISGASGGPALDRRLRAGAVRHRQVYGLRQHERHRRFTGIAVHFPPRCLSPPFSPSPSRVRA